MAKIQVDMSNYSFQRYLNKSRWCSYWHQLEEVMATNPQSLLIVGNGDGIVKSCLSNYLNKIKVIDIDPAMHPDYIGSIEEITSITSDKFDCILCCQVLEHLPFENFRMCLEEIHKTTKKFCIISLPHRNNVFRLAVTLFNITHSVEFIYSKKIKNFSFNGEHYWEIGTDNCSKKVIEMAISEYFCIRKKYNVYENGYHRFYILEKV